MMKVLLVLTVLVGIAIAEDDNSTHFLYKDPKTGRMLVEDLTGSPVESRVSNSDLTFHFYSQRYPVSNAIVTVDDISALRNTDFDTSKETVFLIHGWKDNFQGELNSHVMEHTFRGGHDVNIFVVDWSSVASKLYLIAQPSVRNVGVVVANFIKVLQNSHGLQLGKVKLVGHSLGAHIAGCAGAALNGQIDRIVGLDSAGPLFSSGNINNRLDPTDAKLVQAIHTNGGGLGYRASHGHTDYYPNGGSSQPGCGTDIGGSCAHARSFAYYAESLISDKFLARVCDSYSAFTGGRCSNASLSTMGRLSLDNKATGDHYLTTNTVSPYAMG